MKKFLLGGIVMIAASSTAFAADLAPEVAPTYDWTGGYVGLNAGAAWNNSDIDLDATDLGVPGNALAARFEEDQTVFTGGAMLGYNWQMDNVVFGLEGDFNYLGFDSSRDRSRTIGANAVDTHLGFENNWYGTARGRLGFAADNLLFYGTGGLAFGNVNAEGNIRVNGVKEWSAHEDDLNWGWTIGAGMEFAVDENWTLGAEYMYVDLGSNDLNFNNQAAAAVYDNVNGKADAAFSVIRATAKLKF